MKHNLLKYLVLIVLFGAGLVGGVAQASSDGGHAKAGKTTGTTTYEVPPPYTQTSGTATTTSTTTRVATTTKTSSTEVVVTVTQTRNGPGPGHKRCRKGYHRNKRGKCVKNKHPS